jgi:hypothetical protein
MFVAVVGLVAPVELPVFNDSRPSSPRKEEEMVKKSRRTGVCCAADLAVVGYQDGMDGTTTDVHTQDAKTKVIESDENTNKALNDHCHAIHHAPRFQLDRSNAGKARFPCSRKTVNRNRTTTSDASFARLSKTF